jgi:4-amino-4-deoxy-L-arabinose transferase-like glycosyltransferase
MAVPEPARNERDGRPVLAAVALITLLGLALRLPSFSDSLFGDELSAYYIVAGHSFGQVMHLLNYHSTELNPPLFFMVDWLSQTIFGLSSASMKLVSLLAGTATIPMVYRLGRQVAGVRTGLVAGALAATCPFLIYYSTEARPYALMLFLVLGATLALLRALRTPDAGWGWWLLYAACTCAAAYTHFTSVFALGAIALWALITQPRARVRILAALGLAAIAYLPELPVLHKISQSPGTKLYEFLDPVSVHTVGRDLSRWAIGHPYFSIYRIPGRVGVILIAAAVALGLAGAALRLWPRLRTRTWPRPTALGLLVVMLALAAPVGGVIYSLVRESVWGARNVISSWAGFAVCLAALVSLARRPLNLAATGLVLAGFAIGAIATLPASVHRPDYAGAVAYLNHLDPHGGPVADLPSLTPGPPDETEAALALAGVARQHPVFRIGYPRLSAVLTAPPYAPLVAPRGETIAREAARAAGHGPLFLVVPLSIRGPALAAVRRRHVHSTNGLLEYLASFLGALPPRFHLVTQRSFAGLAPVTVFMFRA